MWKRAVVAASLAAVCGAACRQAGQVKAFFGKLMVVQEAVQQAVGPYPVSININNGKYLAIAVVNSPLHDLPANEKHTKAKELAKLAYATYPDRQDLAKVSVVFWVKKTYFLVFHMNDGMDAHAFDPAELREQGDPPPGRPSSTSS